MSNDLAADQPSTLPDLIDRATSALRNARTSAEILESRDLASFAYDVARRTARMGKARQAHDKLIAAAHRAQSDALEIESLAKRRLADEYDAAQKRGEIKKAGNPNCSVVEQLPGPTDIGLTRKEIHEARLIRDAEQADLPLVKNLQRPSCFVPETDEEIPVTRLIAEPTLLNSARCYMRAKGMECLAEADRLDQLFFAVTQTTREAA